MLNYWSKQSTTYKFTGQLKYIKKMCLKISLPSIYYVTRIEYIDRSIAIILRKALKP